MKCVFTSCVYYSIILATCKWYLQLRYLLKMIVRHSNCALSLSCAALPPYPL